MENDKDISFIQVFGWLEIICIINYLKILYNLIVIVIIVFLCKINLKFEIIIEIRILDFISFLLF
jgi:hypothetical protein